MKIAIIGGGASGITNAYLLNKVHHIDLYEKNDYLGGNIRTLNRNIKKSGNIENNIYLENGVIVFHKSTYHYFFKLMKHLEIKLKYANVGSALFLSDGSSKKAYIYYLLRNKVFLEYLSENLQLLGLMKGSLPLLKEVMNLKGKSLSAFLNKENKYLDRWIKASVITIFSTPNATLESLSAQFILPSLLFALLPLYYTIEGGVYTYIEKMLTSFNGTIFLNSRLKFIERSENSVRIHFENGDIKTYDKLIMAVTPGQVLKLLKDPTLEELNSFSGWEDNKFSTILHNDVSFYKNRDISTYSFLDAFEKTNGDIGYNSFISGVYSLKDPYSYAYNMDEIISKDKIIDQYSHTTPQYDTQCIQRRREIQRINGMNNTYYSGAYLGNGFHEGAVKSAMDISSILGGMVI